MKRIIALSASVALTLSVAFEATAFAPADTVTTNPLSVDLQTVEVNASRAVKKVAATAPTHTLSREKLNVLGVTDIADALHRLPGLNVRDYGGAGGMKTVSVRGFGATHTGVIYDGIVLSDCQSGKIDLSRYSLDNLGSVSMIVGDNSDIFVPAKAAASAATIILNSLSVPDFADSSWHLRAQLKGGSFGMINPFVRVGKAFTDRFALSVTADYIYADNDYPFTLVNGKIITRERRQNSRMNSGHAEASFGWRPSASSQFSGKVYYYDNDRRLPGAVIMYNPECNESLRDRNFFGQLAYYSTEAGPLSWKLMAKFNWDASLYHDEDGKYPGGQYDEDYWQREAYVSGMVLWTPSMKWAFDYSADYAYNNLSSNQPLDQRPYRHSILQSATARFKSGRFLATGRLLMSVYENGVRTGESARDAKRLSPSVSVSVQPFAGTLLFVRTSYKNIFRMPTFNDSYFFHMGSTSLRPELTDQINLGLTWQAPKLSWLREGVFTADVYYNNIRDKIVAIPQNMFIWSMMNLDKARAFGIDVTAECSFSLSDSHGVLFSANYSYQRVQPRTNPANPDYNKQVAYTPRHSGAASIAYENPLVNLSFHASGASARYGTNTNLPITRIAGYVDCGVAAYRTFNIRNHTLEVRADILNLFNKQYYVVARYPMPGRAWRITAIFNL